MFLYRNQWCLSSGKSIQTSNKWSQKEIKQNKTKQQKVVSWVLHHCSFSNLNSPVTFFMMVSLFPWNKEGKRMKTNKYTLKKNKKRKQQNVAVVYIRASVFSVTHEHTFVCTARDGNIQFISMCKICPLPIKIETWLLSPVASKLNMTVSKSSHHHWRAPAQRRWQRCSVGWKRRRNVEAMKLRLMLHFLIFGVQNICVPYCESLNIFHS